jgi:hypothetical protein
VRFPRTVPMLLLLLACSPPPYVPDSGSCDCEGTSDSVDSGDTTDTSLLPSVGFAWPAQESAQSGCAMFVFDVQNFQLVDFRTNPDNVAGQGHLHVYWSDYYVTCTTPYCLVEFGELSEDDYSVTVQLANNDHSDVVDDNGDVVGSRRDIRIIPGACAASVEGLQ